MPTVTVDDVTRMRDQLFMDGAQAKRKLSRYWMLLVLAAVIAAAGVVGDSTATVIGAMIVAPLMTPILGIVLAVALSDRDNLLRSVALVLAGAVAVIVIAWLLGKAVSLPVVAQTSSQVESRVHPRLIDLAAALATGAVGSVALARSDIADTLPGVAIAISLVPPLSVVGLTAESGAWDQAGGALLLFTTNVAAILLSGVVVMALYRVARADPARASHAYDRRRRQAAVIVVVAVVLVAIPLTVTSRTIALETIDSFQVKTTASAWAEESRWQITDVSATNYGFRVRAAGPDPAPDPSELRSRLDADGLGDVNVVVELTPERRVPLPVPGADLD